MGDGKKFKSPEEVRVVLPSDEFKKECVTSFEKWLHENPEDAAAMNRTLSQVPFDTAVRVASQTTAIIRATQPSIS